MSRKTITLLLIISGILSIIAIIIASVSAINASAGTFKFLHLDFNGSDSIIASYSSFIGTILSFFTTLILIYTILYQKWQYQTEKDDLNTIESNRENKELTEHLKLLYSLLGDLIKSIDYTAKDISYFIEIETKSPLIQHMRPTYSRQNIDRIVNLDYAKTFNAFSEIITDEKKTELFKNMYSRIDFYAYALDDDASKSNYHIDDKTKKLNIIRSSLQEIVKKSTITRHRYIQDYPEKAAIMEEHKLLEKFFNIYNSILTNVRENQYVVINNETAYLLRSSEFSRFA